MARKSKPINFTNYRIVWKEAPKDMERLESKWRLIRSGRSNVKKVVDTFKKKNRAISFARKKARDNKPSKLTIENKNGSVSNSHNYSV